MGGIVLSDKWRSWRHIGALTSRWMGVVVLASIGCAWVASLPILPFLPAALTSNTSRTQQSIEHLSQLPSWTDTLIVQISAADTGVQQRFARIAWAQRQPQGYSRLYHMEFMVLADGYPHSYIIPIGTYPDWNGNIEHISLTIQEIKGLRLQQAGMRLIGRSPWALDMLIGGFLAPYLMRPTPWASLVFFVAVLFIVGIALCWPTSHWRRRLGVAGLLIGGLTALTTLIALLSVVKTLYHFYGAVDEATATLGVPAYDASTHINRELLLAVGRLPDGPILLETDYPASYLIRRAQFVFYPRRVDTIQTTGTANLQRQLANGYVGFISDRISPERRPPGWEAVSASDDTLAVWKRSNLPPYQPVYTPGQWASLGLLLGLILVFGLGWGIVGLFGVQQWNRVVQAWPFGVSLVAWWMFSLALLKIQWSWWTIGLPLTLGTGMLVYNGRASQKRPSERRTSILKQPVGFDTFGAFVILILIILVGIRAVLLPFSDFDTWWVWGMRGRGFYIDRALTPMLQTYGHKTYPPMQSLIQSWGYLTMGGISERLIKLLFPIWYVSCLGLIWVACRAWHTRTNAMLWTLLLATTPLFLDHATLGNADLPLAVSLLSGSLLLCRWIETTTPGLLIGSVIALGGAAWIKFDGAFLAIALLTAAILAQILAWRNNNYKITQTLRMGLLAFSILVAIILTWHMYAQTLHYLASASESDGLWKPGIALDSRGFMIIIEELVFSSSNSTWSLLGSGYGSLWFICAGAWVIGWRQLRNDRCLHFLLLAVGLGIGFYVIFYMFTSPNLVRPFYYSIERYLLHIAPIAVLAAARSTRPAQSRAWSQA